MASKIDRKETFLVRKKYRNQIQKLSVEQKAKLTDGLFSYQLGLDYECDDMAVSILLWIMIDERKIDEEKYESVCERNRNNGLKWGRKPKKTQETQSVSKKPKKADKWYMINDKWYMINDNKEINISSNEEIEQSSSITSNINNLISELKQECDNLWIAYDKTKERQFAKHILSAKEYGGFCEKVGMWRQEFASNILKASVLINFWKWACAWPMRIYQNYSEVYNKTKELHTKNQKNLIQSF